MVCCSQSTVVWKEMENSTIHKLQLCAILSIVIKWCKSHSDMPGRDSSQILHLHAVYTPPYYLLSSQPGYQVDCSYITELMFKERFFYSTMVQSARRVKVTMPKRNRKMLLVSGKVSTGRQNVWGTDNIHITFITALSRWFYFIMSYCYQFFIGLSL